MTQDEMWTRLEAHQPYADERGYGSEWQAMCKKRTAKAALAAEAAAEAAGRRARAAEAAAEAAAMSAWEASRWSATFARRPIVAEEAAEGATRAVEWIEKSE